MIAKNSKLKIKLHKQNDFDIIKAEGFYPAEQVEVLSPLETYEIAVGRGLKVDGEPTYGRGAFQESKVEQWERLKKELTAHTKGVVSMGDIKDKGEVTSPTAQGGSGGEK